MSIDLQKYTAPTSAKTKKESKDGSFWDFMNRDIQLFGNQWNAKKKAGFYTEMELLLKAGLDLNAALDLIQESQKKEKERKLIEQLHQGIISGLSLSDAMEVSGKFSDYEVFSIRIAEESGQLPPVLKELAHYFELNMRFQRLLISALSYPILVISVAFIALAFLLNFLVPLFGEIYTRLNQDLPSVTKTIIAFSNWSTQYLPLMGGLLLVLIGLLFWQRKTLWFRKYSAWVMLYIPVFGALIHQLFLSRFCQALSFLIDSKVPLLKAISLTKKMIRFYPIEAALAFAEIELYKGVSLHQTLGQFSIFPRRMIALLKVGEEANQLDTIFKKLADQYQEQVEQQTKLISSLIEPVLIVFLALVVGIVLVSMYLPIFKLVTNFGL
ncbi:MAG: type II secretion system F family protein [Bacteroidota bacterium]